MRESSDYERQIHEAIRLHGFLSSSKLILTLMREFGPSNWSEMEYFNALQVLIKKGEIIQLTYTLSSIGTRVMYFRRGTSFQFGEKGVE